MVSGKKVKVLGEGKVEIHSPPTAETEAKIVPLKPGKCRGCGYPLHGEDPRPLCHQVLELPPIRPEVTARVPRCRDGRGARWSRT